jgi:alpha-tubulin suppressor-like RCC1 family protein
MIGNKNNKQSGMVHHLLAIVLVVALITIMGFRVMSVTHADGSNSIYEWGKPVASGGPGLSPTVVQTPNDTSIDAGNYTDVYVDTTNNVWGWGGSSMTPTQVLGVKNVIQRPVDGNGSFAAIEQPGTDSACPTSSSVIGWSTNKAAKVIPQLNCLNVVMLAKAAAHTYALTANGNVYVWGGGNDNILGLGPTINSEKNPTLVPAVTALTGGTSTNVEITTGMNYGGLLVNGQAFSWGENQYGQCGCGSTAAVIESPMPVQQNGTVFTWIDQGGNLLTDGHELALDTNNNVWAWGDNNGGQLGIGTKVNSNVPVEVPFSLPEGTHITTVEAGGEHSLALDSSGNVWAWGYNQYGEVGNGTTQNVLSPIEVLTGKNISMISAGSYHSIAQ